MERSRIFQNEVQSSPRKNTYIQVHNFHIQFLRNEVQLFGKTFLNVYGFEVEVQNFHKFTRLGLQFSK